MIPDDDCVVVVMKQKLVEIHIEEVLESLRCNKLGLSNEDAQQLLAVFGYNKLEEKEEKKLLKLLSFMWNPLLWVMEAAAIMAIGLTYGGVSNLYVFSISTTFFL